MSQEAPGEPENLLTPEQVHQIKKATSKSVIRYKDRAKKTCWIFVCTNCEGVYRDEPVSQCDCSPNYQGWYQTKITYWVPEKP